MYYSISTINPDPSDADFLVKVGNSESDSRDGGERILKKERECRSHLPHQFIPRNMRNIFDLSSNTDERASSCI